MSAGDTMDIPFTFKNWSAMLDKWAKEGYAGEDLYDRTKLINGIRFEWLPAYDPLDYSIFYGKHGKPEAQINFLKWLTGIKEDKMADREVVIERGESVIVRSRYFPPAEVLQLREQVKLLEAQKRNLQESARVDKIIASELNAEIKLLKDKPKPMRFDAHVYFFDAPTIEVYDIEERWYDEENDRHIVFMRGGAVIADFPNAIGWTRA